MTAAPSAPPVLLGTVALEPNRWGTIRADRSPSARLADLLEPISAAGFAGLEVWENHLRSPATDGDDRALRAGLLPLSIVNSYVSLDDPDPTERRTVGELATAVGATAIKFNVGNDTASASAYAERISRWLDELPASISLLCECHEHISIAEDPAVAAELFRAAGHRDRLGAIVHTHEPAELIDRRFDAYGDQIRHVHINFLDVEQRLVPPLADVADRFAAVATQLDSLGFDGSWTLEFVAGILGPDDTPSQLTAQAIDDLAVINEVLS